MPATSTATATRFNPRPLVRRDSGERPGNLHHQVSTHAPLAGRDNLRLLCRGRLHVSTHAPLAGSDGIGPVDPLRRAGFQPTLPLRGATTRPVRRTPASLFQPTLPLRGATNNEIDLTPEQARFQPTLPLRGVTGIAAAGFLGYRFQPTLPLRGATGRDGPQRGHAPVSTHAPLAGSDGHRAGNGQLVHEFQPTLPLRGATHILGT